MALEIPVFDESSFRRIGKAVRSAEAAISGMQQLPENRIQSYAGLVVEITGPPQAVTTTPSPTTSTTTSTSSTTPCLGNSSTTPEPVGAKFVYPARFVYRVMDSITNQEWWYPGEKCWAQEVNNLGLGIGCRYPGNPTTEYRGLLVVGVQGTGSSEPCAEKTTSTTCACASVCQWELQEDEVGDPRWMLITDCYGHSSTTTTTTTTVPPGFDCESSGSCSWVCPAYGTMWLLESSTCPDPSCACVEPDPSLCSLGGNAEAWAVEVLCYYNPGLEGRRHRWFGTTAGPDTTTTSDTTTTTTSSDTTTTTTTTTTTATTTTTTTSATTTGTTTTPDGVLITAGGDFFITFDSAYIEATATPDTTTSTTTTTTTTTVSPDGDCRCPSPKFCPSDAGCATTFTFCFHDFDWDNDPIVICTSTTATTTSTTVTTTTTTPDPSVCGTGCIYKSVPGIGTITVEEDCLVEVTLEDGTFCIGCDTTDLAIIDSCTEYVTDCLFEIPVPPIHYCYGSCYWVWPDVEGSWWVHTGGGCSSDFAQLCRCDSPSVAGSDCGQFAETPCYIPIPEGGGGGSSSTSSPSTTMPPGGGPCQLRWDAGLGVWTVIAGTGCSPGYECSEPVFIGTDDCSVVQVPCAPIPTTGTTTSTTTTATSTTPDCSGGCSWICTGATEGGSIWLLVDPCPTGCSCFYPTDTCDDAVNGGEVVDETCYAGPATTSSTSTTTPPLPPLCTDNPHGACTWVCARLPDGVNPVTGEPVPRYGYILAQDLCAGGMSCRSDFPSHHSCRAAQVGTCVYSNCNSLTLIE